MSMNICFMTMLWIWRMSMDVCLMNMLFLNSYPCIEYCLCGKFAVRAQLYISVTRIYPIYKSVVETYFPFSPDKFAYHAVYLDLVVIIGSE